jgi:hypothetical protein
MLKYVNGFGRRPDLLAPDFLRASKDPLTAGQPGPVSLQLWRTPAATGRTWCGARTNAVLPAGERLGDGSYLARSSPPVTTATPAPRSPCAWWSAAWTTRPPPDSSGVAEVF